MSNPGPASTVTSAYGLGPGNPTLIGGTTSDLVAFFGTAAVTQPSGAAQAAVATDAATTGAATYGFTSAQANGMVATVNAIRTALLNLGLIKGS